MSTPKLKLLLQALRLGQPQDPQQAIAALAEAIAVQETTLEELRSKLAVVTSRTQILDAKVALLTSDLAEARAGIDASAKFGEPYAEAYAPPQGEQYAPQSEQYAPQSEHYASPQSEQYAPQGEHYAPPESERFTGHQDSWGPPAPNVRTKDSFAPPPLPRLGSVETHGRDASAPTRRPPSIAPPAPPPSLPPGNSRTPDLSELDSSDDFSVHTAVISRRDAERLRTPEAPFRIPPPGARTAPQPQPSIPGAPWARGTKNAAPAATRDDYTADAIEQHGDEGATMDDAGFEAATRVGRPAGRPEEGAVDSRRPGPHDPAAASGRPPRPPPNRSS